MYHSKSHILAVDDDPITAELIREAIREGGLQSEVTWVANGMEALRAMANQRFGLCIMEYALPDITGVQLCTIFRRLGHSMPVMFFTALDRPVDRSAALDAGADEFLSKASDLRIFADTLARYIPQGAEPASSYIPQKSSSGMLRAA